MRQPLGRGLFGSLAADVRHDVRRLLRKNSIYVRARYSVLRRLVLGRIANRSFSRTLGAYLVVLALVALAEWLMAQHKISFRPAYYGDAIKSYLKDIASYLIATQVAILAIVSVAVGVVTLLSQRDNGASINTDVRLYYVESYSYELAVSGVALLIVLTFQLFWPIQHMLHASGLGSNELTYKVALTFVHSVWLVFNLSLFLQFITTTLRFVEPTTRKGLRERYSATELIPRDAEQRLLRANFIGAPAQLFGEQTLKGGPAITFGHGLVASDDGIAEIGSTFFRQMQLKDVWLRPLTIALRSWKRRSERGARASREVSRPHEQIAILVDFDRIEDGERAWVLRSGSTPLKPWERFLIRHSFRFTRADTNGENAPTTSLFLEQLVTRVVDQINSGAYTGFEFTLKDVIDYHSFLLAAQNIRADDGNLMNLAEIGGFISRPDEDWVRDYRRAYIAAADRLSTDSTFMQKLGSLPARLFPRDATSYSARVLQTILELGQHEVVVLEAWLTRKASVKPDDPNSPNELAGSDKRAYESS